MPRHGDERLDLLGRSAALEAELAVLDDEALARVEQRPP